MIKAGDAGAELDDLRNAFVTDRKRTWKHFRLASLDNEPVEIAGRRRDWPHNDVLGMHDLRVWGLAPFEAPGFHEDEFTHVFILASEN